MCCRYFHFNRKVCFIPCLFCTQHTNTLCMRLSQKNEIDIFMPIRFSLCECAYIGELSERVVHFYKLPVWHRYWSIYHCMFLNNLCGAIQSSSAIELRLCSLQNSHLRWISMCSINSFNAMNKISNSRKNNNFPFISAVANELKRSVYARRHTVMTTTTAATMTIPVTTIPLKSKLTIFHFQ